MRISTSKKHFDLAIRDDAAFGHVAFLRKNLILAHSQLNTSLQELSLAMVSVRTMAGLHKQFMQKTGTTDVLTFELEHDRDNNVIGGEIIICPAVAVSAAKTHGVAVRNELLLYALHGMLHLCGFDDKTAREFKIMHDREDQILASLGIGPVFQTANSRLTMQSYSSAHLSSLPVIRERVRVRVRVRVRADRKVAHNKSSPLPSPELPGEGEEEE